MRSSRWMPLVAVGLVMVCAVGVSVVAAGAGRAATTSTVLARFTTHGTYVWTVPTGVTSVTFTVYGASGGNVVSSQSGIVTLVASGGAGGEAKGRFAVGAGETFQIVVGGAGGLATAKQATGVGGYNGGGAGDGTNIAAFVGGGGGGGSDVRIGVRGNACAASKTCGYGDRIIVGGGGGGSGLVNGIDGDAGGGLTGGGRTCDTGDESATQECGGGQNGDGLCVGTTALESEGGFGFGGIGCEGTGWGGGGGGWYGGGSIGRGGGGSGFVSRLSATSSFPGGTQTGDGRVIISTP